MCEKKREAGVERTKSREGVVREIFHPSLFELSMQSSRLFQSGVVGLPRN